MQNEAPTSKVVGGSLYHKKINQFVGISDEYNFGKNVTGNFGGNY
jgi:hypothetical protein